MIKTRATVITAGWANPSKAWLAGITPKIMSITRAPAAKASYLLIFPLVLVKRYLAGMINLALDGRYVGSHLEVMLSFLVIGMYIHKRIMKKL